MAVTEDVYLAERISDKRIIKRGRKSRAEYLVQWVGYPNYDVTWEPANNLLGQAVQHMREEFDTNWRPT